MHGLGMGWEGMRKQMSGETEILHLHSSLDLAFFSEMPRSRRLRAREATGQAHPPRELFLVQEPGNVSRHTPRKLDLSWFKMYSAHLFFEERTGIFKDSSGLRRDS